jgi:hypothetical protein
VNRSPLAASRATPAQRIFLSPRRSKTTFRMLGTQGKGRRLSDEDRWPEPMSEMVKEIPDEFFPSVEEFMRKYPKTSPPYLRPEDDPANQPPKKPMFLNFKSCTTIREVAKLATDDLDDLAAKNLAAVWARVVQLLPEDRQSIPEDEAQDEGLYDQLDKLMWHTILLSDDLTAKELSSTVFSIAKIVQNAKRLGWQCHDDFHPHPAHEVVLGDFPYHTPEIVWPFTELVNYRLSEFDARHLSNAAYAHALLGLNEEVGAPNEMDPNYKITGIYLFPNIAGEALQKVNDFNARDVSQLVWAFATMKVDDSKLFQSVGDVVAGKDILSSFKFRDLSETVWAFATAKQPHHDMFKKIGDAIISYKHLRGFKPEELSNIAWAFATAQVSHPALFQKIGDTIAGYNTLDSFEPEHLTIIGSAFKTAKVSHPSMFQRIGNARESDNTIIYL